VPEHELRRDRSRCIDHSTKTRATGCRIELTAPDLDQRALGNRVRIVDALRQEHQADHLATPMTAA
jgi:hypothetical protein